MRPGTAVAVWAAALVLGGTAGLTVPDLVGAATVAGPATPAPGTTTASAGPSPTAPDGTPSASPTPSPTRSPSPTGSPSPSASPAGPPTRADLLSVRSFADASVTVVDDSPRRPDRSIDATSCVSDDVHATQTLAMVTGHEPVLEGDWSEDGTGDGARQQVAVADDADDADDSVTQLVISLQACQKATPGHFVLGSASTVSSSATRSTTTVGYYPGDRNTTGRAPEDGPPCGGTVLARNGARFTVVVVYMCLDDAQLASLADSAAERLG